MTRLRLLPIAIIAPLVAAAPAYQPDPQRGAAAYQKCYSCHALEPRKNDLDGPSLNRILGRRIAAMPGVDYSPALRALAKRRGRWDAALLDRFVADPEAVAPRTRMNFAGIPSRRERADLIAYLRSAR